MIDRNVLEDIAYRALRELGLHRWRVFYADSEPETLRNKTQTADSALNLRFHLHVDDGETAHIIRVRIPSDVLSASSSRDAEIRKHLLMGLRRVLDDTSTH